MEEEEKGYKLNVNLLGLAIPIGLIVGGVLLYLLLNVPVYRVLGLFLVVLGLFSLLGISFPLVQLLKAKASLEKEEERVKLERIEEKIKEGKQTER